jgi:signal recognition particle GTPase
MSLDPSRSPSQPERMADSQDLVKRIEQLEQHQRLMARAQQNFLDIFEKMERQQDQLVRAQEILTNNQSNLANAVKQLADSQLQLTRFVEKLEDRLVTANAAIEHLDRLMDYVLRESVPKRNERSPDEE